MTSSQGLALIRKGTERMSNNPERGGRAAPSRSHLTRRPGNKPGEQPEAVRDHNDTVPSTTEPTCGPLVSGDFPEIGDKASAQIATDLDLVNKLHGTYDADSAPGYYEAHQRIMEFAAKALAAGMQP
jgi:hypothetical protein